ncbi:LPS export ABC transporter periplasmic protein LptC [Terrarubrum flagellatum]|uniref:LPS export ABC transporter periplasmic protein LptC n=1 Tax=Terrirubrum flagellatum TaxID=2895980 RepID=UPI003145343D
METALATVVDGMGVLSGDSGRAARRAVAYRAALRHSRRVRFLKWAIPIGSVLATLFILVVMIFDPFRKLPQGLSIASVGLDGSKIVMAAPRLQGYRSDATPYEVTAKAAAQDIKSPNLVELTDLDAKISLGQDGRAHLQSPAGLLDSQREILKLRESVRVVTDTGYDVRLKSATVEFKTGYVRSDEAVSVKMNDGTIDADSLEIIDNGKQIVFSGRVRSLLTPRDPDAPAGGDGRTAAAEEKKP